jgi:hypothetical protein
MRARPPSVSTGLLLVLLRWLPVVVVVMFALMVLVRGWADGRLCRPLHILRFQALATLDDLKRNEFSLLKCFVAIALN